MTAPARAVFALLVIASFGAFFVTQRLKHTPTVVQRILQTPFFGPDVPHHTTEHVSFKLKAADLATVTVESASGATVRTLLRRAPVPRYHQYSVRWDGSTDRGGIAAPGVYRIRITLLRARRSVLAPRTFRLDTAAQGAAAIAARRRAR